MLKRLDALERTIDEMHAELAAIRDKAGDALTLVALQKHQLEGLRKQLKGRGAG